MNNLLFDFKENIRFFFKYFLLLCLLTTGILPLCASYTLHRTDKLDLSNNAVLCMYQDKDGYMWFGTYDGLNLYNGKNTFVYRAELDNEFSLCSNIIHNIIQSDNDHLWISTFLGLNKFSLRERKITESYPELPEAKLIASNDEGETWVISKKNYISYYIKDRKAFTDIHLPGADMENVKSLFYDEAGSLYMITIDGKLRNIQTVNGAENGEVKLQVTETILHEKNIINAFYENGNIYYVSIEKKLFQYDLSNKESVLITDLSALIERYGGISRIVSFKSDLFIAFNDNGLIKLDTKDNYKPVTVYLGIRVFCLLKDKNQDILWIGTDGRGVQMYYQGHDLFGNITFDNFSSSTQKPVRSIYTDENHNLWIGTKGDGIMRVKNYDNYNHGTISQSQTVNYTTANGLTSNLVFCFLRSKYRDVLWLGTEGPGFSYYSYKDDVVKILSGKSAHMIGKVHSICEIDDSTLWMATAGQGLLEVKIKDENSRLVVESVNEYVLKKNDKTCVEFHSMFYDGESTLYIGSRGGYGVAKYNIRDKQYEFLQMKNAENSAIGDILCVYQSQDSNFYIGASSGMTRIQFQENGGSIIKQFDRRNGMNNDMIHGILEDSDGCIWLSTNKGLIKYNPLNDFFHNYSYPDLKVTEFSDDAYWKCPLTGRLFFGGINGLVWVEPKETVTEGSLYRPDLYFFDLEIAGESYTLHDFMNERNNYLEIKDNVPSFTISFVATDYINGDNYEYSYMLENYNDRWTELQKNNNVTFTNLPPGDYLLKVKYKNDVFDSAENFYTLAIRKLPPWYRTNWAYFAYIFVFILTCGLIIYFIRKRIINKNQQLAQRIKEEQKEKLLESKLNFFTNVTHEFCTPLTVIKGVSEYIEKSAESDENLKKYTDVLRDNVTNLNNLIQEILDFRKMEEGQINFSDIEEVSIFDLVDKQVKWFIPIAEQNNIQLKVSVPQELNWNTNVLGFNRVLVNLISNAFKYTTQDGIVEISATIIKGRLELRVYNTGQGIEESKIPQIFDRYGVLENIETSNSYSSMTSRNGLGLSISHDIIQSLKGKITVKSEVDKYAEFIVTLPYLPVVMTEKEDNKADIPIEEERDFIPETNADNKKTVLVVDDNKDIVWLITNALSDTYIVKSAYTVEEALKIIASQTPALVITDIMMPNVDGLEFIRLLKEDKFSKHIPIIVISAKITEKDQSEGLDIGADAYLTKPFSTTVLRSVMNRLLTVKDELKDYYYSPESAYNYSEGQLIHQEDKAFMDSVVAIISENLEQENLRPEFIAEKLNMNTRNLYRRFKKISALSPNDFIKDYRFTYASKLLITTSLTIQEIIYKVGITNKSYFYREFLKKYNMTPKEYRSNK